MQGRWLSLAGAIVVASGAALWACSGDTENIPNNTPLQDSGDDGTTTVEASATDTLVGPSPETSVPDAATCANAGSKAACRTCCNQQHPVGIAAESAAVLTCACAGDSGPCVSACSTLSCANPPKKATAGTVCEACLTAIVQRPVDGGRPDAAGLDAGDAGDAGEEAGDAAPTADAASFAAVRGECFAAEQAACLANSDCLALVACDKTCP
jgi:hypothetical protein